MKHNRNIFLAFIVLYLSALIISSCGGSGGGSSNTSQGTQSGSGSVAVFLKDSPADDFSQINITISRIGLISNDRNVTVFSGIKTLNLLDLKDETMLFSVGNNVSAAQYNKIRLYVEKIELVKKDTGEKIYPDLPANGKIDLNLREMFTVVSGKTVAVQLDMDAEKSIHIVRTGNQEKYIFRPVVFIDVLHHVDQSKLMRIKGTVSNPDPVNHTFNLLLKEIPGDNMMTASGMHMGQPVEGNNDDAGDRCLTVRLPDDTSFFSAIRDGGPATFDDLAENSPVTVIGFYMMDSPEDDDNTPCEMTMSAVTVEIGEFAQFSGMVRSGVISQNGAGGQFDFELDQDQGIQAASPIKAGIHAETKIYSSNGDPLPESSIHEGVHAIVDGILLLNNNPVLLNAAFILLDTTSDKVSGTISNIDFILKTFDVGTTCVGISDNVDIFQIEDTDDAVTSEMTNFADLTAGVKVDVYGTADSSGCFEANTIIVY
ncbi:MAG: DUF4382 domain-containing protein [Nitrospirae bacterium]|nr:DUF4382 domain-containing protein [Nitrospirota bacterium]